VAAERCASAPPAAAADFEAVWPRRFELDELRALLGEDADRLCSEVVAHGVGAPVWSLVERGGGRWRPAISRLAFLASGGVPPVPAPICQVSELLHTGSLIIDDIQDDAEERRGGPATHTLFGTATALNAANAAYFRALAVLRHALADDRRLRALDMLSEELFVGHLGQALDLALGSRLWRGDVRLAHYGVLARAKTGALVRIAARLGAIAAGAGAQTERALAEWASDLGVAYQIRNDLDDLAADMRDVVACRPTYPVLLVLDDDGPAASALRAYLRAPSDGAGAVRELRALFAREHALERGHQAAARIAARALEALTVLPAGEARSGLERIALALLRRPTEAAAR
jgi:geranylgeranyl pyrophosphate synthase